MRVPLTAFLTLSLLASSVSRADDGCLAPPHPDELILDDGILASEGLSPSEINDGIDALLWDIRACLPMDQPVEGELEASLTVACTGAVTDAAISRNRGVPDDVAACVSQHFAHAVFPRHQLPEGFDFVYIMAISSF